MRLKHLRKSHEFRRIFAGREQRRCLDCDRWLDLDQYASDAKKGHKILTPRCKPCYRAWAAEKYYRTSERKIEEKAAGPMPKQPPSLTWDAITKGL